MGLQPIRHSQTTHRADTKTHPMLKVESTNSPIRFLVQSESGGQPHLVDVSALSCTCRDDAARCAPRRRTGAFEPWPHEERSICKHTTAVLLRLGLRAAQRAGLRNEP